ncbi:MAG: hypothetical protein QOH12_2191 [Solirubrobacteraceae bacterium]|nr:hypothetical protein [Solirubrobacteraceae bacterium]
MTNETLPLPDHDAASDQAVVDRPASVSAFVAAAITEHHRDHGFSQLLADLDAAAGPTEADRTWARKILGAS